MFEDPMQWIVIGIVAIALLMWGPNKIPELAASIGRAKREFDSARKSIEDPMNSLLQSPTQASTPVSAPPQVAQASGDEVLVRTAREMGIATEGKTKEQLSEEIVSKAGQKAPDSTSQQAA